MFAEQSTSMDAHLVCSSSLSMSAGPSTWMRSDSVADKLVLDERTDVAAFSKELPLKADAQLLEILASFEDDVKATISLVLSQEEVYGLIEDHSDLFQLTLTVRLFLKVCMQWGGFY